MNKAKTALIMIASAVLLIGCTQSYSASSSTSPSAAGLNPQSATLPAEATMMAIHASFLTQTAQAHALSGATAASNTPAFATVNPTASISAMTIAVTQGTAATAATTIATTISTQTPSYAPVPTATPGLPASYTIHEGETLYCLARRFNINPQDLITFNGLANPDSLQPSDTIKIPTNGSPFPPPRALHTHTPNMSYLVKSGDTIYTVGCFFGDVDPNAIILANNLQSPDYTLTSGKNIRIP